VYWSLYLRDHPCDEVAVVIGIGEKSFTVLIEKYGFESRIFVDEMANVQSSYDSDMKTIALTNVAAGGGIHKFGSMQVSLLAKVVVHLSAKSKPPIDISVQLVCPAAEADVEDLRLASLALGI
jgi:exoribonuclease R